MSMEQVFDTFGLLEHVLSFVDVSELLESTAVNRRWKEAGRLDDLWKRACTRFWTGKLHGLKENDEDDENNENNGLNELTLYWRPLFTKELMGKVSVRLMRSVLGHALLEDEWQEALETCLEKSEMQTIFRQHCMSVQYRNPLAPSYSDLWFGAYASSRIDARRSRIIRAELCSPHGFDMYFKLLEDEVQEEHGWLDMIPYEGHPGILLYHHSICYFEKNQEFYMEVKEPESAPPTNLRWRWEGCLVQVGPYPSLQISRLPNWGWKLENIHVVLQLRDTMSQSQQSRRQQQKQQT